MWYSLLVENTEFEFWDFLYMANDAHLTVYGAV